MDQFLYDRDLRHERVKLTLRQKCKIRNFLLVCTVQNKSPYSVRIREKSEQRKLRIRKFFTHCDASKTWKNRAKAGLNKEFSCSIFSYSMVIPLHKKLNFPLSIFLVNFNYKLNFLCLDSRKSLFSVQTQENTDQKELQIRRCLSQNTSVKTSVFFRNQRVSMAERK